MSSQDTEDLGESKAKKRKWKKRRPSIHTDQWADTTTLPLRMADLKDVLGWSADRIAITMLLVWHTWVTQQRLPDDISDWPSEKITRTFGRDPRVVRRLYTPDVLADVRRITRARAPLCDGGREWVFEKSGGACHHCGGPISEDRFHVDHLVAVVRGGLTHTDNLVASCPRCNLSKGPRA